LRSRAGHGTWRGPASIPFPSERSGP
jgi:hypothetical protein